MAIHQLAVVHPNAKIGKDVVIEAFATIYEDVVIGDNTWVGPNAVIMDGARIGKECKIFPGAVISAVPQDLKYNGEITTAEIGDNTTIRECVTINKGTIAAGKTVVGSNCLLMACAHIAHDCIVGDNVIIANATLLAGHIEIDDWAIIGGMSAIHQFVKIGCHVMLAGASKVAKDIPPYTKAAREPLAYVGINSIGLRRRGLTDEKINEIQDVYRILYQKGMNVSNALEYIEKNVPVSEERDVIVNFVRNSKRGVMKGYSPE